MRKGRAASPHGPFAIRGAWGDFVPPQKKLLTDVGVFAAGGACRRRVVVGDEEQSAIDVGAHGFDLNVGAAGGAFLSDFCALLKAHGLFIILAAYITRWTGKFCPYSITACFGAIDERVPVADRGFFGEA